MLDGTVAILAQGTSWAVASSQASLEQGLVQIPLVLTLLFGTSRSTYLTLLCTENLSFRYTSAHRTVSYLSRWCEEHYHHHGGIDTNTRDQTALNICTQYAP